MKGKEIIAHKGGLRVVYRVIDHTIYMQGKATEHYYKMLANWKDKHVVKDHGNMNNWVYMTLIDEIDQDGIYSVLVPQMARALEKMGFKTIIQNL